MGRAVSLRWALYPENLNFWLFSGVCCLLRFGFALVPKMGPVSLKKCPRRSSGSNNKTTRGLGPELEPNPELRHALAVARWDSRFLPKQKVSFRLPHLCRLESALRWKIRFAGLGRSYAF